MKTVMWALMALMLLPAAAQDRFPDSAPRSAPAAPQHRQQAQPLPPQTFPTPQAPPLQPQAGDETRDFGVRPTDRLHPGPMHGPTPGSIPGAKVITTPQLAELLKADAQRVRVFDVLGGPERLPNALNAVPAHQGGGFDDAVQGEFGRFLQQVTQGRNDTPLVFYCQSVQCWMSYNAALRAAKLGYRNVLWYRGGVEAWKAAGLPVQGAGARQ